MARPTRIAEGTSQKAKANGLLSRDLACGGSSEGGGQLAGRLSSVRSVLS